MGKIHALIANATPQFSAEDQRLIKEAIKDTETFINSTFVFDYDFVADNLR